MAEEEKSASPEGIRHVRAPAAAPILDVLVSVGLEREAAVTLLDLGAIYVERVRVPPGTHGMQVAENAYIRIHTHPRRFPLANTIDWRARIQHECPDFILVDKPGGVPVHPSLDNSVETCVECVSKVSGDQLTALHRLDVPTHGLLVLGRTPSFTSHFNKLLRERTMSKEYRALVWARPAEGLLVHYMEPSKRSPKVLSQECVEGWQDCKLIIKNVRGMPPSQLSKEVLSVMLEQFRRRRDQSTFPSPVSSWASRYEQGPPSDHSSSSASGEEDWCSAAIAYEVEVELLTGRTHQIRAQLSHVGCPLVGDEMYTTHVDQRKITADAAQRKVTEDASHRSAEQTNTAAHGATEEEGGAGEEREKEERERRWREQQDLAREMEVQVSQLHCEIERQMQTAIFLGQIGRRSRLLAFGFLSLYLPPRTLTLTQVRPWGVWWC